MALSDKEFAQAIYDHCGGSSNIASATNCMTRLRLTVKDVSKFDAEGIKKIPGVLSLIIDGNSYQIVIGPGKVKKVTDAFLILADNDGGIKGNIAKQSNVPEPKKKDTTPITGNWFTKPFKYIGRFFKNIQWARGFRHIGNIFSPLVPGFIMFGILYSIACIILVIAANGDTSIIQDPSKLTGAVKVFYLFFLCLSKGFIAYLSVLVGINSAKEFNVSFVIGAAIGGLAIFPDIVEIAKVLGWQAGSGHWIIESGQGGVLAVILGVFLIGFFERWVRKWMPNVLDVVCTPVLTIIVGGGVFLFGIMPVMGFIMTGITTGINYLTDPNMHIIVKIIVGFVLGAVFLPLVMLGLHRGLDAIYIDYMSKTPFKGIPLYPVFAMADAAQAGAGFAIYLKAKKYKHKTLQQNAIGGVIPQVLGVSEPLIYGVTLPMGKPFITVGIGAGIAGAFIMATGVQSAAYAVSGLMAIPIMIYVNGELNVGLGIGLYVAGWAIAVISAFLATLILVTEKDLKKVPDNASAADEAKVLESSTNEVAAVEEKGHVVRTIEIPSKEDLEAQKIKNEIEEKKK